MGGVLHGRMRVPIELEHLIRNSCDAHPRAALNVCLTTVEARRALEVENYLRACTLRLDQTDTGAWSSQSE